jgi:hypothetical protein
MSDKLHRWELLTFRITMWLVASTCIAALVTKARIGKPTSVPFHYLLIICMVAAVLALLVPRLDAYGLSKLKKINVAGVELELLADSGAARELLKYREIPASEQTAAQNQPCDRPFPLAKLSGPQQYHYERLSYRLYQVFDQVSDPTALDRDRQEHYRELVRYVGGSGIAMKHYTKALDILSRLHHFEGQGLTAEELRLLGVAHLWAADEISNQREKTECLAKSLPLLRASAEKDPYEVRTIFSLGWGLLSLLHYQDGIDQMKKCIHLDGSVIPWAKWNIACGLKKLGREQEALQYLREVEPGCWWLHIKDDDWFKDEPRTSFSDSFDALCAEKLRQNP